MKKKIYTGGTLGDAYIILLKLLYYNYNEITHVSKHSGLFETINKIYSLKSNLHVNFEKRVPNKKYDSIMRGRVEVGEEIVPFPSFKLPKVSRFNLPIKYNVIQLKAGIQRDHRILNKLDIKKVNNNLPIVIVGKDNLTLSMQNFNTINLRNKTTLLEAFSIIKNCNNFYGLNGVLSFASLSFKTQTKIFVKNEIDKIALEVRVGRIKEWDKYVKYLYANKDEKTIERERKDAEKFFGKSFLNTLK